MKLNRNKVIITLISLSTLLLGVAHAANQLNLTPEQQQKIDQIRATNLDRQSTGDQPSAHQNAVHTVLNDEQKSVHQQMMANPHSQRGYHHADQQNTRHSMRGNRHNNLAKQEGRQHHRRKMTNNYHNQQPSAQNGQGNQHPMRGQQQQ